MNPFEWVSETLMSTYRRRKEKSSKILTELAPVIMTPQMITNAANASTRARSSATHHDRQLDFATLGRAPLRITMAKRRITSRDLEIVEVTDELLDTDVPEPEDIAQNVSLLRGFNATMPSAGHGKERRRRARNLDVPKENLRKLGLASDRAHHVDDKEPLAEGDEGRSVVSEDDVVVVGTLGQSHKSKGKRKGKGRLNLTKTLGKEELNRQKKEIMHDKEDIHVRRSLIHNEIAEIEHKIQALDAIRIKLEGDLLKLQEEELELDDELMGVKERMQFEEANRMASSLSQPVRPPPSSRRRRGPVFLPSEHDELPIGVAFMTLEAHTSPITALDFTEPYGTLVTASEDETQPCVWDLLSGDRVARLRGHTGTIRCLQVENQLCLSGSEDGTVRVWDLKNVMEEDDALSDLVEEEANAQKGTLPKDNACIRVLLGHTKAVTALYFEDDCLVTGASDKTLRQWDLTTGQCVMTMDILWAISQAPATVRGPLIPNRLFPGSKTASGFPAVPAIPRVEEGWDAHHFVGGVQFWGYGLVSGSGDGAVRMWDMRTGLAHRTLLGHTAPVTCLQFDEIHIVTGSLDKCIRVWDVRTGGTLDTLKYDYGVTSLQFDTRKIVAANGENGIKIYNRTTQQHSTLMTNGHTRPVERLRYMDRYLISGGQDATVKIWSF